MKHRITGEPFDFDHCCKTCKHFTDKTRKARGVTFRTTKCAADPEQRNLADIVGVAWQAMPACTKHKPRKRERPPA